MTNNLSVKTLRSIWSILFIALILSSCIKDNKSGLVSQWQLIEASSFAQFYEVESDRTIDFFDDGTISSNGNICEMITTADEVTTGTYVESEGKIYLEVCGTPDFSIDYLVEDGRLLLNYNCFNGCTHKYLRLK